MIIDTSALLAYFDTDEPDHQAVAAVLDDTDEPLVVSPYVVAELDYLVASRLGVAAELAVLAELTGGAWDLPAIDDEGLKDARDGHRALRGPADRRRRRLERRPCRALPDADDRHPRSPALRCPSAARRGPLQGPAVAWIGRAAAVERGAVQASPVRRPCRRAQSHPARSASVGGTFAARIAGYSPAIDPTSSVAPKPIATAGSEITTGQPWLVA